MDDNCKNIFIEDKKGSDYLAVYIAGAKTLMPFRIYVQCKYMYMVFGNFLI